MVDIIFGNFHISLNQIRKFDLVFNRTGGTESKYPRHIFSKCCLDFFQRCVTPLCPLSKISEIGFFLFLLLVNGVQFFFGAETGIGKTVEKQFLCKNVVNVFSLTLAIRTVISGISFQSCAFVKNDAVVRKSLNQGFDRTGNLSLRVCILDT